MTTPARPPSLQTGARANSFPDAGSDAVQAPGPRCCEVSGNAATQDAIEALCGRECGLGERDSALAFVLVVNARYELLASTVASGAGMSRLFVAINPTTLSIHSPLVPGTPLSPASAASPAVQTTISAAPMPAQPFGFLRTRTSNFNFKAAMASLVPSSATAQSEASTAASKNKHPHFAILSILSDFSSHVMKLESLILIQEYSDELCMTLKSVVTFGGCVEILSRFEDDLDAIIRHEGVENVFRLLSLFSAWKTKPVDVGLSLIVLTMWRDAICLSLVILIRCMGGTAVTERWREFLRTGRLPTARAGATAAFNTLFASAGVEIARVLDSVVSVFKAIPTAPIEWTESSAGEARLHADIALFSLFALSCLTISSVPVQALVLTSPDLITILCSISSKCPIVSGHCSNSVQQHNTTMLSVHLSACLLLEYMSLVSPPGSAQKHVLCDTTGLTVVELLKRVTSAGAAGFGEDAATVCKDFEFLFSLVDMKAGLVSQHEKWESSLEDAFLMASSGGGADVNDKIPGATKVVLGLLVGACDPRFWVLSAANVTASEEDLELIVSDSEVMDRVRCIMKALLTSEDKAQARLFKVSVFEFLSKVFEFGANPTATEGDGHDAEAARLGTKRSVCLGVMDQLNAWNILLGPNFHEHPSAHVSHLAIKFIIASAVMPDTSNAGLILILLTLISDVAAGTKRMTSLRILLAICHFSNLAFQRTVDSLIKLDFLQHLSTIFVHVKKDQTDALDLSKLVLQLLDKISKSSFAGAIYISRHETTRSYFFTAVAHPAETSSVSSELLTLANSCLMSIMGTLLSVTEKHDKVESHPQVDYSHAVTSWLSSFFACFNNSTINSVDALNMNLRLLKCLRGILKMYSGGSIERSRVRSRLVDSKVLEFLLGLFSVTFNLEAEINTLPFVDSESTGAQMPSSSFETPTQSSSPLLPLECMIRTHSHAIMSTISSILTGSILANRCFIQVSGVIEIAHRLFVEDSRVTIWPGFLNDVLGLLVPKVNLPVKDEYQYFSVDEGDELIQISPDLVIRNLSVLESFIGLYGICTDTLRLRMLDYLEKLASGHEMNRVLMTQAGLVGIILKKVLHQIEGLEQLERFIKLLEVVGNYSISVAEAKYLFKCLRHYQTPQSSETDAPLHSSRSQSLNRSRSQSLTSLQTPTRMSRRASASLFDSRTNASRLPFYYDMLLKSVLKLFQRKEPDLDMFYFSGRNSGLLLPTFEKWPTSGSGYSFLCWIKIQEYPGSVTESNTGIHSSDRVIWSMRTGSGDGVELRISSNLIGLYVYKAGQEYSLIVSDILLLPKRWYFINVCHPGPKLPWFNEPEATIFMNGFGRATGKLPYPDMQMHTLNRIGATGISQPLETPTRRKFFGREAVSSDSIPDVGDNLTPGRSTTHGYGCTSSFCGQTTSMYLFEDILTLQQVQSLYDLGPGHCSQFKVEDLASYPDVGKVLFDGSLNSRIVLQFYPTATKQGSVSFACFDIGPRHSGDSEMRDVMACSSKCLQTSVHAFGGIEVMFPLLTHLNYPIESVPSVGFKLNPGAGAAVETPTIVRNARLTIFLQIISLLLGNDVAHMERFAAVQGPRVISMMLQQQNLSLVNMKSLDAIMALDKVASEVSLLSPAIAIPGSPLSSLSDEIQECLVFEYRIWAVTEGSVQLQHAEFLNHYLLANIDAHRSKYGVSFLLDTLEKYYWTVAPDYLNTDLQIKIMASRPDATFIFKIRSAILSALSDLILKGGGIRPDECHRLILSLWTCSNDSVHVLDLVNLMIDFCLGFASNAVLETFLANSGAMEILLHLIFKSEMEQIRISVLKLMLVLMKSSRTQEKWKRKLRLEELPSNLNASSQSTRELGAILAKNMASYHFSRHMYLCLLQLAVEEQLLDWHDNSSLFQVSDLQSVTIVNGSYLVAILQLLSLSRYTSEVESNRLITCALEDLLFVVSRSPANSEQLRKISGWQVLLVDLLFIHPMLVASGSASSNPQDKGSVSTHMVLSPVTESPLAGTPQVEGVTLLEALPELVLEIFCTCVLDGFISDRRMWRVVEEAVILIWLSKKCGGLSNGLTVIALMLKSLLKRLRSDIQCGDADMFTGNTLENAYHLISLVEEFLFSHGDMFDELMNEVSDFEAHKSSEDLSGQVSFFENLGGKLGAGKKDRQNASVQMAYPFHENRKLAEECVHLVADLLDFGITHVGLADTVDKAHTRPGGLPRIQLRLLLNAISTGNHEVWSTVLPQFMALFEKHASFFMDDQSNRQIGSVLAQLTDSYKLSLAPVGTGESASSHPTTQAIFPLFVLVINQSYDYISGLWNASESSVLSRDFMEEIESNPQNFAAFVTSASWSNMYEKNFYLASREGEAEEISAITALKKRYAKVSKPYVQKVARQDMIVTRMSTDLETHINVLITRREGEYYMLIPEALVQQDQERRLVVRRWLAIFHALTQERGIWLPKMAHGSESTSVSSMVKWKLDRTENHLRMHQRFIQNFEFDDHSDAAQKRDRTPSVNNAISVSSGSAEVLQQLTNSELAAEDKKKSRIEKLKQHNKTAVTIDEIKLSSHSIGALISNEEDLAVEEWDVINNDETAQPNNSESEKILCGQDCEMILLMTAVKGRLELSSKYLTFFSDLRASAASMSYSDQKTLALVAESEVLLRERRWSISKLREAYFRRYKLRNSAIEFFFTDGSNCFFNFKTPKPKLNLMSLIVRLRPQNLKVADPRNPMEMIGKSDITERWQRREISNFEYLMHLNTVSGRTSNDLTQYPVFPWILKDYTSTILDLSDPNVYRDLSKPIGALDPTRLQQYIHRFENFDDPSGQIKKFMYGTHYSSSAAVLFYMLRVEPFTSLHIALQGGKFDHPDRQFDSIEGCWKSVLTGNGDVKELIPEFFYMPEFLVNENGFDLGTKQTGTQVNHVTLPPWASSPEEFIRIHREALEGDFVSAHLHEWIDLIWGYKQTGPESVKAHNVFYYLTYEGAINIDSVQDPVERRSIEDQINNFGQTPTQLFKKAHPARLDKSDAAKQSSIFSSKELDVAFSVTARNTDADSGSLGSMPFLSSTIINASVNNSNKVSTNSGVMKSILGQNEKNRMITVDSNLLIGVHRWSTDPSDVGKSFLFEADTSSVGRRRLPCYLATDVNITQNLFAVSKDAKYLFTGGHWDSSFQVIAIDLGYNSAPRTMDTVYGHHDIVTSLALSEDGSTLVTGSRDTTVIAWEVVYNASGHEVRIQQNTRRVFYGHDEEVSCVTVHTEQDLVVSGSLDGTCIVHALGSAQYIRTIKPAAFTSSMEHAHFNIAKIVIMKTGLIIHSEEFGSMMVNMPDQANVNSVIPATSVDDLKKNRDSIIANRSAKSSYLDVFSVNGKVQCSRRFSLTSLDDFVASRSGTTLFLTSFEQPFAAGPEPGEKRGGLTIELVNSHDLTTIFKQSVSGSTRRKSLGGMRDRSTTLHTVSNEQCLFVGYTSDQVLVFVAQ